MPLTRQFLILRSEIIGPVLTKIWDTPGSATTERKKHVIEPTFVVDYTTEIANQAQVPLLNDASDFIVGGAARVTYGVTNRSFYRSRPGDGQRSQTREFVTVGVNQTYYTNRESSLFDTDYVSYSRRPKAIISRPSPSPPDSRRLSRSTRRHAPSTTCRATVCRSSPWAAQSTPCASPAT